MTLRMLNCKFAMHLWCFKEGRVILVVGLIIEQVQEVIVKFS